MSRIPAKTDKSRLSTDGSKLGREVLGLASIFLGLLIILSLASFDGRDPWLNHVVSGTIQVRNKAGLFGSYLAGLLYDIIGAGAWAVPAFFCLAGIRRILGWAPWPWWRWTGFALLGLSLCLTGAAIDLGHVSLLSREALPAGSGNISNHGGGIVGHIIYMGLAGWMGPVGAFLVWFFSLALALQMLTGISLPEVILALGLSARTFLRQKWEEYRVRRARSESPRVMDVRPLPVQNMPRALESPAGGGAEAASSGVARSGNFGPDNFGPDSFEPGAAGPDNAGPGGVRPGSRGLDFVWPDSAPDSFPDTAPDSAPDTAHDSARNAAEDVPFAPDALPDSFGAEALAERPPASPAPYEDEKSRDVGQSRAPEDRRGHNDLVHPLLPRPERESGLLPPDLFSFEGDKATPRPESIPASSLSLAPTAPSAPAPDDDEDMPPWVRDFEMGIVGVPGERAGRGASPVPAPALQRERETSQGIQETLRGIQEKLQGARETSVPPVHPVPVQPALEDDEDLYTEVWGSVEDVKSSRSPSRFPAAEPENSENIASQAVHPAAPEEPSPLLSARTAAALDLLRHAAASGPDPALRPGPDALSLDSLSSDALNADSLAPKPPQPNAAQPEATSLNAPAAGIAHPDVSPDASPDVSFDARTAVASGPEHKPEAHRPEMPYPDANGRIAAGPEWAAQAFEDEIPIFEAPPVEQDKAHSPGLARRLAGAVARPRVIPLPSLDLLRPIAGQSGGTPREALEVKGRSLMTCLKDFGIQGELVGITPGPVVTMFEVRPAPGVRVSRISNLSDDLALALKAVAVRIQAPVPGTDTVGVEIPNEIRETVSLRALLGSTIFTQSKSLLTLALGKDVAGNPAVADLATMPHLLVAGATGAGKSVGINSIILSLLYKARPEEVQLLLVDPKRVEMAIYADLPHLVHPVVTEMQLAKNALEWAVAEMERRYDCIARAGVRNIADYNAKIATFGDNPPEGMYDLEFMPYLVLIIDELADLMLVAAKEVENSIVRLAQLARAAGIHLILATQRPSVDVVTGLIKANFPCRISFQVTSKHDSRTILDTVGAEHLLGKGDMLFKPAGSKSLRMHGAFVSDKEVNAVVGYWKSQQPPRYRVDFADWAPEGAGGGVLSGPGNGNASVSDDPLYNEAVEFVRQQGKASISLIQRKFRIGFNKAARYIEQMEMDGIIGPADGSKPRVVIG